MSTDTQAERIARSIESVAGALQWVGFAIMMAAFATCVSGIGH